MIAVQPSSILSAAVPVQSSRSPARAEHLSHYNAIRIDKVNSRTQKDDIVGSPFVVSPFERIGAGPPVAGPAQSPIGDYRNPGRGAYIATSTPCVDEAIFCMSARNMPIPWKGPGAVASRPNISQ